MTDRIYCIQTDCANKDCDKNISNHKPVEKPHERYVNDQVADVRVKDLSDGCYTEEKYICEDGGHCGIGGYCDDCPVHTDH